MYKLRHVVGVARHGGFAKAAAAMNISQSALTKSVQSVELRLGVRLFERGPRGVRLTAEGEWFVQVGGRLLADAEQLAAGGQAVRTLKKGVLRAGCAPAALDMVWIDAIPSFARRFPAIRLELIADSVEHIGSLLLNGEIDLAVGALMSLRDESGLEVSHLYSSPVEIFVRRGHPLDRTEPPDLARLFSFPMVMPSAAEPHSSVIRRIAKEQRSAFEQPHIVTDSFALTRRVVEQTDAFSAVVARQAANDAFQTHFRSWEGWQLLPPLTVDLAVRAGWEQTPAAREIIRIYRSRNFS